ncbi:MAG: SAM-dependent methyltransferase, partial [Candidatus Omnitrophica bacterium]|nr:SAM-dependent methyltransferase [Candidatus Omnitrophota bacterium]
MKPRSIKAKESQNQIQFDTYQKKGPIQLGPWTSHIWRTDPKHLVFVLARYKFCAKMLAGKKEVLEIGCGDAFGVPVVLQTVES